MFNLHSLVRRILMIYRSIFAFACCSNEIKVRSLLDKADSNTSIVEKHVVDFFLHADTDGSGTVSFEEYQAYSKKEKGEL